MRRSLGTTQRFLPVIITALLLSACASSNNVMLAPDSALPAFLDGAPARVREAYRFAVANPDELAKYPCYCGCVAMGHTSNLSCYVSEIGTDGAVTFDTHATDCGICVDITQDVMRLLAEGRSSQEARAYIDATYSAFGPSTNTPLP